MSVGGDMKVAERRQAIWEILMYRRYDTAANLAIEFHVSPRTMYNDLQDLMRLHPLESIRGSHGGGYKVADWYFPHRKNLCQEQLMLLRKLAATLSDDDRRVVQTILEQFAP